MIGTHTNSLPRPALHITGNEALVRRLARCTMLSPEEQVALADLTGDCVQSVRARSEIVREGDEPRTVTILIDGWACRYRALGDGRRQMFAILLPGDLFDVGNHVLHAADHNIAALTPAVVAQVPHSRIDDLMHRWPGLAAAFWWQTLTSAAMQREWTLGLGQRSAAERLGSLFCEVHLRLAAIGQTRATTCDFPLTQADLADATGLTTVHVNRTLQDMRAAGLIQLAHRLLDIPDFDRLAAASAYTPHYLHLHDPGQRLQADRAASASSMISSTSS